MLIVIICGRVAARPDEKSRPREEGGDGCLGRGRERGRTGSGSAQPLSKKSKNNVHWKTPAAFAGYIERSLAAYGFREAM